MIAALFIIFFISLLIGIPIAFSILLSSVAAIMVNGGNATIIAQRFVTGGASFTMLAVPLFIYAGMLMQYGSTKKLVNLVNMFFYWLPGSMGSISVISCAIFGAISGSAVATTAAIGSVLAPEMVERNYDKGYGATLLGASGVLGSLIPPSIVAVVYAGAAGTSVGKQLLAGTMPGIVMAIIFIIFNTIYCKQKGWDLKPEKVSFNKRQRIKIILEAIPPLLTPVIIIGGIMGGVFTPTEAAAVACVYGLFLSTLIYKELDFKKLMVVTLEAVKSSAMVMIIISAAAAFGWILTTQNVPQKVSALLFSITTSPFIITALIIALLFILGFFMEGTSIIILTTPILLPIAEKIGYDPIHFGVILIAAICIGTVTPPVSVGLYTACSIFRIRIEDTFPAVIYMVLIMILSTIVITLFPTISLWLPNILMGTK